MRDGPSDQQAKGLDEWPTKREQGTEDYRSMEGQRNSREISGADCPGKFVKHDI